MALGRRRVVMSHVLHTVRVVATRRSPAQAREAFLTRLSELGGRLAPQSVYVDTQTPVEVICAARHTSAPRPANVLFGGGICRPCAGTDPVATEAALRPRAWLAARL